MINLIVIPQNQKLADLSQNLKVATKTFHSEAGPSLEWLPRVLRHPLRFGNRCQVPILIVAKAYKVQKSQEVARNDSFQSFKVV